MENWKVKALFHGILTGRSEAGCTKTVNSFDHHKPFKGKFEGDLLICQGY